jgi:hypothetical protein
MVRLNAYKSLVEKKWSGDNAVESTIALSMMISFQIQLWE